MAAQLPGNPWEVKYSFSTEDSASKPAVKHPHSYRRNAVSDKFPLFSLLPPELRVRIWSLTVPHKRVVEIRSWGSGQYAPIKYSIHPHYLPAIFHVCKESRMEARRIYKRVGIGVSSAVKMKGQRYVDWQNHPANPNCKRRLVMGSAPLPRATPHAPEYVYVSWEHDIIYLGPEFQPHHLFKFIAAQGEGRELEGLQYLALDRKLWRRGNNRWGEALRNTFWSLRTREDLKEIILVPDDEERCLIDRWYYGKHEITLEPPKTGDVESVPEKTVMTFAENLEEWLGTLWKIGKSGGSKPENDNEDNENEKGQEMELEPDAKATNPPKVSVMSVMRNGQIMKASTDGISDIQKPVDIQMWKSWTPPASS